MKVAYDYQIFARQRFGGVSRYFYEIANKFSANESEVDHCLINCPLYINEYLQQSNQKLDIRGIQIKKIASLGLVYTFINKILSPLVFSLCRPDILHETYYTPKGFVPKGSRVVVTVYDMIHELYPQYFDEGDRTAEFKRIAVERADHVICISENTRQDLIQLLNIPSEKISVVHLGFELTNANPIFIPSIIRPYIFYVGSREGYKNFERLLAAYASSPDLIKKFDLVLFGGGSLKSSEVEMIQRMNIPLKQVNQISGNDGLLASLYKQADMFVYPSIYEGFGIPPLEAMSFDCPVACSNTSSIPEIVGDAAIKFNPFNIDSIADAMNKLSLDSVLRSNLIGRGRIRIEKFSWEKCAKQTLDVYKAMLQ